MRWTVGWAGPSAIRLLKQGMWLTGFSLARPLTPLPTRGDWAVVSDSFQSKGLGCRTLGFANTTKQNNKRGCA